MQSMKVGEANSSEPDRSLVNPAPVSAVHLCPDLSKNGDSYAPRFRYQIVALQLRVTTVQAPKEPRRDLFCDQTMPAEHLPVQPLSLIHI